jgi:hypothetical protein
MILHLSSKLIKQAIIVPALFGLSMIFYHGFGSLFSVKTQQVYSRCSQYAFYLWMLWIVSYFLPGRIRKAYRLGYCSFFALMFVYRICKYFDALNSDFLNYIWTIASIFILLFAVYLLNNFNKSNTCQN